MSTQAAFRAAVRAHDAAVALYDANPTREAAAAVTVAYQALEAHLAVIEAELAAYVPRRIRRHHARWARNAKLDPDET